MSQIPPLTRNLKLLLANYRSTLPTDQYESFFNHVLKLVQEFTEDLSRFAPGASRGRRVHQLMEREILKASKVKTSCQKGCAACCHFEVEVTSDDAEVLADAILSGRAKIDRARVRSMAKRESNGSEWQRGVVAQNRCVFLTEENLCGAYEHRPSSCRRLAVLSPASYCSDPLSSPEPLIVPMAEIVMSASLGTVNNLTGPLAKMLDHRLPEINEVSDDANVTQAVGESQDRPKPPTAWS